MQKGFDVDIINFKSFLVFACDSKNDLEVDNTIEQTFSNYVEYWSEKINDFDKIVNEIYGVPFVLYKVTQERDNANLLWL